MSRFTLWQKTNEGDPNKSDIVVGEAETEEEAYALQDKIIQGYAHLPGKHPYAVMIAENETNHIISYGLTEFDDKDPEAHRKKIKRNRGKHNKDILNPITKT